MKQQSFTPFSDLPQTIKGCTGEDIIQAELLAKGYRVLRAVQGYPDAIDFFAIGKDRAFLLDAKTYNRLATKPEISIDTADLNKYIDLQNRLRLPVLLVWLCTFEQAIFYCSLDNFRSQCVGNKHNGKSTIHLKYLTFYRRLSLEDCRAIGYPSMMYNGATVWFTDEQIVKQESNRKWL